MALDERANCPGAGRLAEYADGVLGPEDRAAVERHLVDCEDCRAVIAGTMAFLEANPASGSARTPTVVPFRSRRWVTGAIAGLAAAAALVITVRVVRPQWLGIGSRTDRPELQELIAALANEPTRPVEGRLTGGFKYAPAPSPTRGPGDREIAPDVRIAAAKLEKLATSEDTAANRAAVGLAFVATGDLDKAIEALEDAAGQAPTLSQIHSDLAAAYLARARAFDRAEDWSRALAAADRAIRLDPSRLEPLFNRALALEGLHLTDDAIGAWTQYATVDAASDWSRESVAHVERLRAQRRSSSAAAGRDNQTVREQVEDRLLADWGRRVNNGDLPAAATSLSQAERDAATLVGNGGDAMPQEEIQIIRAVERARDGKRLNELAAAHDLYGRARESYVASRQDQAAEFMRQASDRFARAGSPYQYWGSIFEAILLRNKGDARGALERLSALRPDRWPIRYRHLHARFDWTRGVALGALARFDAGQEELRLAVDQFRLAGEHDNHIATATILAEAEGLLGDRPRAWADLISAFESADRMPNGRNYHLLIAANLATADDRPEAALEFHNARVRVARTSRDRTESFIWRARTLAVLSENERAMKDLVEAEGAARELQDPGLRDHHAADVRLARAEILVGVDDRRAIDEANAAIGYVRHADPAIRLASLLTVRARAREALGDSAGARTDYLDAISAFEAKRATLESIQDRTRAFEQERATFKDLVHFETSVRSDFGEALRVAERSRAGVVLERWTGPQRAFVDPTVAHRDLPEDVAIIYFEAQSDRVLTWVLTREKVAHLTSPIGLSMLRSQVARVQRAIQAGMDLNGLRSRSASLHASLIAPAIRLAGSKSVVFFVPDGPLFAVPFGALPDPDGRPLIATRTVGVVPNLTTFLAASQSLRTFVPDDVLAVGDGHDPVASGLPRLPRADDEAAEVGSIYPTRSVLTGAAATKQRVLNDSRPIVHFAGHAVVNLRFPQLSRILLADDPGRPESGELRSSEIAEGSSFRSARVVVLATCDGAAGMVVEGEGAISIARAFFSAGVPAVVASLWPVGDDSSSILTAFHRHLRSTRDAAGALRLAQLAALGSTPHLPVRAWGGFVAFGGTGATQ